MREFIKQNFVTIVLIVVLLGFFKGCNDTREISKIRKELTTLKDSVATKSDIRVTNKKLEEFQGTLWGFGDSYSTLLNIVGETKIENKSTKEAFRMFSNEVELKKKIDNVK